MVFWVSTTAKENVLALVTFKSGLRSLKKARETAARIAADEFYRTLYSHITIYGFKEGWHQIGTDEQREQRAVFKEIITM